MKSKSNSNIIILLLSTILLYSSCTKREWNNPFDPNCPKDYWTPTNFKAIQEGSIVKLTWEEEVSNFSGFRITKQVDTGSALSLDNPAKGSTQLSDASLTGGKVHTYSLVAYAGSNESDAVTVKITPVFAPALAVPTVSTIASNSIVLTTNITLDGGVEVTARGVCWSTNQNPTISDNKTTDGNGNGSFNSTITGLSPGTVYYIRAYATNSVGTSYSSQINSTTNATLSHIAISSVTSVTSVSLTCGGTIETDGGAAVTTRGVCWNTTGNPTIADKKTADGAGIGNYTSSITELTPATTYYIRAYATNSIGTSYSSQLYSTTSATLSNLTNLSVSFIGSTTITCGGNITSDGGATITTRGVCWNSTGNPMISDTKTIEGTGIGSFTSSITGLTPATDYFIRAYATNSIGTSYSGELKITTTATLSGITTAAISSVNSATVSCGGTITTDGGAAVIARGVCWNTKGSPTLTDAKTADGTGAGSFVSSVTGLTPATTYYIRAYATNSVGTSYGEILTVTTPASLPTLTTATATNLAATTLTCGGNISSDGGSSVTTRGVCWSTTVDPTVNDNKTTDGSGVGSFTSSITGLAVSITYYIRAYAINSVGVSYGNVLTLKTSAVLPAITTGTVTILTSTTATCGGNVTSDGGSAVTMRGVCWGTSTKPTTAGSKTIDSSGAGTFSSSITGLSEGSTYYIRAYAVNSIGTAYGNEVTLVASLLPSITTTDPSAIKTTSAQSGGNITSNGGSPVTAKGLCWSTSQIPTIANSHTSNGSGTGAFISNLTGLTANTIYYIRAYATNSAGTSYGQQKNIVTSYSEVTDVDGNIYQTVKIGNQIWMSENFKATRLNDGTPISIITDPNAWNMSTLPACCFYDNDAAKNKNSYGALYNGYTVATAKLAPAGWHIPTASEWETLSTNSGGYERLMETGTAHWSAPAIGNNFTGFTALPAGTRNNDGTFASIGTAGKWWTCEVLGDNLLYCSILGLNQVNFRYSAAINAGLSVRLIQGTVDLPVVNTTQNASDILVTSATLCGTVSNVAGPTVTSRGVCWAQRQAPLPTIADNKTVDGSGIGSYKSTMTGLTPGTTYICRAYATNSNGTSYGSYYNFTTQKDEKVYNPSLTYGTVSDVDGNSYKTISIGTQTWLAENLKTTKLNDGTPIPVVTDNTTWANESSYACCFYKNDASLKNLYGPLYNWNTVNTGKLCPVGWHVPANNEWIILTNQLGVNNAGGSLKELGTDHWNWNNSNVNATNESGFTALPGGTRHPSDQYFGMQGLGYWWSSTPNDSDTYFIFMLQGDNGSYTKPFIQKNHGLSIRCLKD